MKKRKHPGICIDDDLHYKLHFIAKYEGRSANGAIIHLLRREIERFKKEHGKIVIKNNFEEKNKSRCSRPQRDLFFVSLFYCAFFIPRRLGFFASAGFWGKKLFACCHRVNRKRRAGLFCALANFTVYIVPQDTPSHRAMTQSARKTSSRLRKSGAALP